MKLTGRDLSGGLANLAGLSRILGVTRGRMTQLAELDGFPEPIALAGAPDRGSDVYPVAEVITWRQRNVVAVDEERYPFPGLRKVDA